MRGLGVGNLHCLHVTISINKKDTILFSFFFKSGPLPLNALWSATNILLGTIGSHGISSSMNFSMLGRATEYYPNLPSRNTSWR